MIKNYLKIAFRNLLKNKMYSFINIFGLSLGLFCFLLIALYVFDELTYDGFHKNSNSIYRVIDQKLSAEGKESKVATTAFNVSEQSPSAIPEIKKAVRMTMLGRANITDPASTNAFYEPYLITNADFLNVFDFKLLEGNRSTALKAPRSAVLTEDMARKIFGVTSVTGRTIKVDRDTLPYTITAVLKNFPSNSHISFNIVFSEASVNNRQDFRDFNSSDWSSNTYNTYLMLDKEADEKSAAQKLNKLIASHKTADNTTKSQLLLQPIKNIHFHSAGIEGGSGGSGNIMYVIVFSVTAFFVLLIACINYMNLTTARFASRTKEIAVRKVNGAMRNSLIKQFFTETFLMALIALVLALTAAKIFLPAFNQFAEKQLSLDATTDYRIWLGVFGTIIIVGLLAGAYPAFYQSRLKPFVLLKNKVETGKSHLSLRRGLVVFQFALSIIMIVATMVVFLQMKFVNTTDMGFNKEQLLVADINSGRVRRSAEALKNEYEKIPGVKSVCVTSRVPGEWKNIPLAKLRKTGGTDKGNDMYFIGADDQFLKTYEVALLKGRNFSSSNAGDSSAIIINETAAAMLGISEATEQPVEIPAINFSGGEEQLDNALKLRIVGIAKDFNFRSLREKVAPMIIAYQNNPIHNIDYFSVRLSTGNAAQVLKQMETILHQTDAGHLFEYNFLDKQWDLFYREDQKRQTIFFAVALLTILIACLGLFGLATYAAEQRIKEIGIRKVLGASVSTIVTMLSKDFLKLVTIAALLAIPVSAWIMNSWLKDFAYHISIEWWVYAIAGTVSLLIAILTVSYQAIRAAVANPVKSLRTE